MTNEISREIELAHEAWLGLDNAWHAELVRVFKGRASLMRYKPEGKGVPGSRLRQLHDAWVMAGEIYNTVAGIPNCKRMYVSDYIQAAE